MKNNMRDLVSIIIRTCNRPQFLSRAIESVYSQDYPNIEIIVVNDAGIDVTDIIQHFRNLPLLNTVNRKIDYIVNKKRIYRSSSANVGLHMAQGKYIGFLDDDDMFLSNHISSHVKNQDHTDSLFSISKAIESVEVEDQEKKQFIEKSKLYFFPEKINKLNFLFFENYFPNNTIMFQKKVLEKIGKFDAKLFVLEDWDFFIRLFLNFNPVMVDEVTCIFSSRGDLYNIRLSRKYRENWKQSFKDIREKYRKVYKNSEVSIPISEVSDFLTDYAKEWYDFYRDYEVLRDSTSFKIYRKMRKIIRYIKLFR